MIILLFYGQDGYAAKARRGELLAEDTTVRLIHSELCIENQPFDRVEFMPDVDDVERARIYDLFGIPAPVSGVPPLPLPPPPPFDPLANLAPDWRSGDVAKLKALAAAVGDGRAVDNKEQAIAVIEAVLEKRTVA